MKAETYQLLALMLCVTGHRSSSRCEYHEKLHLDLSDANSLERLTKFLRGQNGSITSIATNIVKDELSTAAATTAMVSTTIDYKLTAPTSQSTNAAACAIPRFTFKDAYHLDYIRYRGTVPDVASFSVCFWIRSNSSSSEQQAIVSYCVPGDHACNTFVIWLQNENIEVSFTSASHSRTCVFGNGNNYHYRTQMCVVKSGTSLFLYTNASCHKCNIKAPATLNGDGVLILGQNLDGGQGESAPEPEHEVQGFIGDIGGFQLWNKSFSDDKISSLYQSGECACPGDTGLIVSFNKSNSLAKENASVADWSATCP